MTGMARVAGMVRESNGGIRRTAKRQIAGCALHIASLNHRLRRHTGSSNIGSRQGRHNGSHRRDKCTLFQYRLPQIFGDIATILGCGQCPAETGHFPTENSYLPMAGMVRGVTMMTMVAVMTLVRELQRTTGVR